MTKDQAAYWAQVACVREQRRWGWQPPAGVDEDAQWLRSPMGKHRGDHWVWKPTKHGPVAYAHGASNAMSRAEVLAHYDA